jgi:hypothetical protein
MEQRQVRQKHGGETQVTENSRQREYVHGDVGGMQHQRNINLGRQRPRSSSIHEIEGEFGYRQHSQDGARNGRGFGPTASRWETDLGDLTVSSIRRSSFSDMRVGLGNVKFSPCVSKKVYAVRKGYRPGLYFQWAECKLQVKGFPRASFKSFKSLNEVERWLGF